MDKKKAAALLIASSIIWAVVIISCALALKGTEYKDAVNKVTFIGVIVHMQLFNTMLLWGGEKKNKTAVINPGATIIASAIIWGAVMIAASSVLKGTEFKEEVLKVIRYGTFSHFLFIWAPMGIWVTKLKKENLEKKEKGKKE